MDLLTLDSELRAKKIRPCYLIYGEESYFIFSAKKRILDTLFLNTQPMVDSFEVGKHSFGTILDTLKTPSLFGAGRAVVISEADHFRKEEWEILTSFFAKSLSNVVVILLAKNLPKKLNQPWPSSVGFLECRPLYPRQIPSWINMEARDLKVLISKEAALSLAEYVGTDLGCLRQALEMLSLYVGEAKGIQPEDVEVVFARTVQKDIFEFTKALGQKKILVAFKLLNGLLDRGEEPLRILGMISRQLRLLAKAQYLLKRTKVVEEANAAKELGVHTFFVKDYLSQAKDWQYGCWPRCFEAIYECDHRLKSSRLKPRVVLEKLLWTLTSSKQAC